jgi:predicted aspartyl protease
MLHPGTAGLNMKFTITIAILTLSISASAAVSNWVPFDNVDGHISMSVSINGVEARAILDSGATNSGVSVSFLEEHEIDYQLGQQITVSGIAGKQKINFINGLDFGMFGANFEINQMVPYDIQGADVIIGLKFFDNFVLQIDYPNSLLRIITHDSLDLNKIANVPIKKGAGSSQPIVKVDMNGEANLWLTLDTGNNSGILIPRRTATRYNWLERYGTVKSRVAGVTASIDSENFNLPELTIGPIVLENVIVIVPGEGELTNVGKDVTAKTGTRLKETSADGILGYDVLKHFIVTIDYKRSFLHLAVPAEGE